LQRFRPWPTTLLASLERFFLSWRELLQRKKLFSPRVQPALQPPLF